MGPERRGACQSDKTLNIRPRRLDKTLQTGVSHPKYHSPPFILEKLGEEKLSNSSKFAEVLWWAWGLNLVSLVPKPCSSRLTTLPFYFCGLEGMDAETVNLLLENGKH